MKRYLMQDNKLANVASGTTTTTDSTTIDTATYVDAQGFDTICVLSRVKSTTASATASLKLLAASVSTGVTANERTTVTSLSTTVTTTDQVMALHAPANAGGSDKPYFAVKVTAKGAAKVAVQNLYFLGGPRRAPIETTTTATEDREHHINTVLSTTVGT